MDKAERVEHVLGDAVRFGIVGVVNTAIDFGVLTLAQTLGATLFWAVFFGYVIGGVNGYILNNKWTYRRHNQPLQLLGAVKYVAISFVGLALTELVVYVTTSQLGYSVLVGKLVAVVMVFSWNFFANRFVTFRPPVPVPINNE